MAAALNEDYDPNHVSMEMVLPGVNQRLAKFSTWLGTIEFNFKSNQKALLLEMHREGKRTRDAIADAVMAAAQSFREGGGELMDSAKWIKRAGDDGGDGSIIIINDGLDNLFSRVKGESMLCYNNGVCTIEQVYNKYNGLEEYEGAPTAGGWATVELKFKSRWRSERKTLYNAAESKFFTRVRKLCRWIDNTAEQRCVDVAVLLADLDKYYKEKRSFSGLVDHIDTIFIEIEKEKAVPLGGGGRI